MLDELTSHTPVGGGTLSGKIHDARSDGRKGSLMTIDEEISSATIVTKGGGKMVDSWNRIHKELRPKLNPNKRTAAEVLDYAKKKYPLTPFFDPKAIRVAELNAMGRIDLREQQDYKPDIAVFLVENEGNGAILYERQYHDLKEWMDEIRSWELESDPPVDKNYPELEKEDEWKSLILISFDFSGNQVFVEGSQSLMNELFAYHGLDEEELENPYLVYWYAKTSGILEEEK